MKLYISSARRFLIEYRNGGVGKLQRTIIEEKDSDAAWNKLVEMYPDADYEDDMEIFDNTEDIRKEMFRRAGNKTEQNIIYWIIDGLNSGKLNVDNYYDVIRERTKRIRSDREIKSWQYFADMIYQQISNW